MKLKERNISRQSGNNFMLFNYRLFLSFCSRVLSVIYAGFGSTVWWRGAKRRQKMGSLHARGVVRFK